VVVSNRQTDPRDGAVGVEADQCLVVSWHGQQAPGVRCVAGPTVTFPAAEHHRPLSGTIPHEERRSAEPRSLSREPERGLTVEVCDAWPVRRQTYGYLPSRRASPPVDRYQIVLLGDRGTCVRTTWPRLLTESGTAGSRTRDLL